MKSALLIVALLILTITPVTAQYEFSLTGYVMDIPSVQDVRPLVARAFGIDRTLVVNVARVRLRPTLTLWADAQVSAEYEIASLYHSTDLLFTIQSEDNRRQVADLHWTPVQGDRFNVTHFVDRLHFKQTLGRWDIVLGRQRIAWGTGRVWNPTDLFNPINPTSFAKIEKDGVDAALVRLHIGDFTDLSVVVNPQKDWKENNAGFRFRTNYSEFDFSLMGGVFDSRVIVGGDFAGNLWDAGVRGEGIVSANRRDVGSKFVKMAAGVDYQFTSTLYALAEYHFNGEGARHPSQYDLSRLANGEIVNVGRNFLTLQSSLLLHPLVNATLSYTRNLDDRSQFLGLAAQYSASDEVGVALGGQLFIGDDFSEYWWYPNSLFLKAEFFF
jgi:hypothetical protein